MHFSFLYRLAFFKAAFDLFDAEYYVKADDDIYLRPGKLDWLSYRWNSFCNVTLRIVILTDRLATLLAKDRSHRMTYIGCMKKGPVITDPKMKWLLSFLASFFFLSALTNFIGKLQNTFLKLFSIYITGMKIQVSWSVTNTSYTRMVQYMLFLLMW